MKLVFRVACLLLLTTTVRAAPLPAPIYSITDLGVEPQWNLQTHRKAFDVLTGGVVVRVGPEGQVAGVVLRYPTGKPPCHLFFTWSQGRLSVLGMLPLAASGPHHRKFYVNDINSAGEAVVSRTVDYDKNDADLTDIYRARAYLWRKGRLHSLGTIPGSNDAEGQGINEQGDIACISQSDILSSFAFVWRKGKHLRFPLPPSYPFINGLKINNADDVVGTVTRMWDAESFQFQMALYHKGRILPVAEIPGWPMAIVLAANSGGEVLVAARNYPAEEGYPPIIERNYLWSQGKWQIVETKTGEVLGSSYGPILSTVTAMNSSREVVGWYGHYQNPDQRAFVYHAGQFLDLNALIPAKSDWHLLQAYNINDAGQIVGYGKHNGKASLFLLTPVPQAKP